MTRVAFWAVLALTLVAGGADVALVAVSAGLLLAWELTAWAGG